MDNETNTQELSGQVPDDAIFYKGCGCPMHTTPPQKIATFNTETSALVLNFVN